MRIAAAVHVAATDQPAYACVAVEAYNVAAPPTLCKKPILTIFMAVHMATAIAMAMTICNLTHSYAKAAQPHDDQVGWVSLA